VKSVHLSEAVFDGGQVDIRSIKSTMMMDVLRCKTPEMVRKEIWAHPLAYNLVRTVMAVLGQPEAAQGCGGDQGRERGRGARGSVAAVESGPDADREDVLQSERASAELGGANAGKSGAGYGSGVAPRLYERHPGLVPLVRLGFESCCQKNSRCIAPTQTGK
jgi:hypothetical protein